MTHIHVSYFSFNEKRLFFLLVPLITKFMRVVSVEIHNFVFMTSFYGSFIIKDSIPRNIGPIIYYFMSRTSYPIAWDQQIKISPFDLPFQLIVFTCGFIFFAPIYFDILELCGLSISTKFSEWLIFNLNDSKHFHCDKWLRLKVLHAHTDCLWFSSHVFFHDLFIQW